MKYKYNAISLFSGAGGMDVGFAKAGIKILWANEIDKDACDTYEANHPESHMERGDLLEKYDDLGSFKNIDFVFGGPPCQGFSVAGKMNPKDKRSTLLWSFLDVIEIVSPLAFICENVKALATLDKWAFVRDRFIRSAENLGYSCFPFVLNASNYGVPQKRERVFFVGILNKKLSPEIFTSRLKKREKPLKSVRDTIYHLGPSGTLKNPLTCTAKITLATNPVLRKSPYAGMLFNGLGRPIDIEGASATLPASMGGNKTPIIDESVLYGLDDYNWVINYHKELLECKTKPVFHEVPSRLRRLTINEAMLIQTFPEDYRFCGSKTSIYKQIGNAVPCLLAEIVARATIEELEDLPILMEELTQQSLML